MPPPVPFNRPHVTGDELRFIRQAVENLQLSANGEFTRLCQSWLEERLGAARVIAAVYSVCRQPEACL